MILVLKLLPCMNSQLSGVVLVALLTRTAISGLIPARQLSNAESVLRVTPSIYTLMT